jgi:hypothetical protein
MASLSLSSLPRELLRHICGNLPCSSALDFLLVCRSIYRDCNDWTVWREIARQDIESFSGGAIPIVGELDRWKRYVVAATKATSFSGCRSVKDLQEWLPQLAALSHPSVLHVSLWSLSEPYVVMFHSHAVSRAAEPVLPPPSTGVVEFSLHSWKLAQAAAFSLAMYHLSAPVSESDKPYPDELLESLQWARIGDLDQDGYSPEDQDKRATMQHAIANRAIGFFGARLRSARDSILALGLPEPPSATGIPFSRLMKLPPPFTPKSLESFSKCHLPIMTDPSFFVEGEWTGYTSTSTQFGPGYVAMGGAHHDGFARPGRGRAFPDGIFPNGRLFEGVVRFHLVGEDDGNQYRLQSNNFHSELELHSIRLTVTRKTGQITINHWHRLRADFMTTEGVISPFGIMTYLDLAQMWIWLWKVDWVV